MNKLESILKNHAFFNYSFLKDFLFVLDFFFFKEYYMKTASLSLDWLSRKSFYINCGVDKFTMLIASFFTVIYLLLQNQTYQFLPALVP